MTFVEKFTTNYIKYGLIFLSILAVTLTVYTATASTEYTSAAYEDYLSKLEVEANAHSTYLKAQFKRCGAEKALAEAKLTDLYNDVRSLQEGEDEYSLVEKSNWDCVDWSQTAPLDPKLLSDEQLEEQNASIEPVTGVDISCLAYAVAIAETNDCTTGMGITKSNCHGLMEWPAWNNYQRTGRTFASKDESYAAFRELWETKYGGYPTWQQAVVYTGNDNPSVWYGNMESAYNTCTAK
jgi:hypothetical protein